MVKLTAYLYRGLSEGTVLHFFYIYVFYFIFFYVTSG